MNHLLIALLATAAIGAEPETPKSGDKMIEQYLQRLNREQSAKVLDGATTRAEWEAKLPRLRQEYFDMLGLWPLPEKTPLKAAVTGTLEYAGIVIEKLHFQSKPGLYVTGNLYRPKEPKGRLPTILYVCGHERRGRDGNKTAFQDHGLWFVNNGYVCLVLDTLERGEITGIHAGLADLDRLWWQAAGYTPAGVECWNGIHAIDYLVSRKDVDADRIGVTGISGGGAATIWISAADERVKVAVPVSGNSDLESYLVPRVMNSHCDCMFLLNTYRWEWPTIPSLIAPRPILFANSDDDKYFPMDGNRRVFERLRRVYKMYDKSELLDEYVSKGGHAYRPDLRLAVFKFLNKHLKNDNGAVQDADFKPLPGKDLRVFPESKDLPTDPLNAKIDELFVPRAVVPLPETGKFEEWKNSLMQQLRERSFRTFPERIPAAKRDVFAMPAPYLGWETESGIAAAAVKVGEANTLLIDLNPSRDLKDPKRPDREYETGLVVFPRGVLASQTWTRKPFPNYVERCSALLGRTVDQGRVWNICALTRAVKEHGDKQDTVVIGRGSAGILAAYAALFEPSIKEVIVINPPASHKEGPYFLGVLRVLDIPDALGMLAPRKLTLINAKDKAFERTAAIYKLAGAADKLQRK